MSKQQMMEEQYQTLTEVHELVSRASTLLRPLGTSYERVGWMLEDALSYLQPGELVESFDDDVSDLLIQAKVTQGKKKPQTKEHAAHENAKGA